MGNPETRADQLPIMVIKDRASRGIWAHPVPTKGLVDPYGWKRLVGTLDEMGYRRIILKSDQERSMRAVCMEAKRGFKGDLVPEKAPVEGHERSNGEVERAVQMIQGITRTLKEFVEYHADIQLDPTSPIFVWMIEHAATLYLCFHKGEPYDGLTPWQRLRGKPWKIVMPGYGEKVHFHRKGRHKFDGRFLTGVFLGVERTSGEKYVGNADGVFKVQSMIRLPPEERWDGALLKAVKGVPWKPVPGLEGTYEVPTPPMPVIVEP